MKNVVFNSWFILLLLTCLSLALFCRNEYKEQPQRHREFLLLEKEGSEFTVENLNTGNQHTQEVSPEMFATYQVLDVCILESSEMSGDQSGYAAGIFLFGMGVLFCLVVLYIVNRKEDE